MQPAREKRWKIREWDPVLVGNLAQGAVASPLIARLLACRKVENAEQAEAFLSPVLGRMHDPFLLKGMDLGVTRLLEALDKGETVCIHGDYDVDGITATALLTEFFRAIGLDCFWFIPNRLLDGYGLSPEGVSVANARGARVMVTVDCGITAIAEARLCAEAGIDLIITDHHLPGEQLPDACAIINPQQEGCSFPFKLLSGVGVAFNLLVALRARLRERGYFNGRIEPDLRSYLDLVALGTVADVVPLVDENRIFVAHGLKCLTASQRVGIQALKRVAGIEGEVGCGAVGFRLAPRLNACGRLDDASLGVELLLTGDRIAAEAMAAELDAGNAERQAIEKGILHDALAMVKAAPGMGARSSIVLASADWHPGVIGIVASRLVDLYHRPAILIALAEGAGRGSGRSIPAFHLLDALRTCEEHLLQFGGHHHAAGLAITEEALERFSARFDEVARGLLNAEDLVPVLNVDGELLPEEITPELVEQLAVLKPFGMGNPEPLLLLRGATMVEGRTLGENHLKMQLLAGGRKFEAIAFGMAEKGMPKGEIDLVFTLGINSWRGRNTLQLNVKDYRSTRGTHAEN